jgi:undecaprenyl diphosphate synthase
MTEREGPAYVAIVTDGNGRWAKARGLPVGAGHRAGAENVRARLRDAVDLGIRELTVYAFSTENWSRSPEEVKGLIELLAEYIDRVTPELHAENVRLRFIGERGDPVPQSLVKRMEQAEELTAANQRITLFVPFNYGGRAEIVRAARAFIGTSEEEFRAGLYAPEMHDPELLIRTGGERRLSNYLLWQVAESELVFSDELWPDFSRDSLEWAIRLFAERKRRRAEGESGPAQREQSARESRESLSGR